MAQQQLSPNQASAFNQASQMEKPGSKKGSDQQLLKPGANSIITAPESILYVQPTEYGTYQKNPTILTYPYDAVQLDIYNDQDFYYETINEASGFGITGDSITVDLEQQLANAGYEAGDFKVAIRPIRNYLGSALGIKLVIQEVSTDRLEVRLIPAQFAGDGTDQSQAKARASNEAFSQFFSDQFFRLRKQEVLANLYLFTDNRTSIEINDYIQDKFTFSQAPYSIVFKLNEQLPSAIGVNSLVWIAQEINPQTIESVVMYPQLAGRKLTYIKGPNFDILRRKGTLTSTEYLGWDEILAYNSQSLIQTIFSQSSAEGTPLNVDYSNFDNFVKFSSAYERIRNFEYKIKLIEDYQNTLHTLSGSNASESFYVSTQVVNTNSKINTIVGAFDGFERYMYYESSSYISNSFGEFLDMAWPKSTSTKPYLLYPHTSSQVENWLEGILQSASLYDNVNPHSLRKLIPSHIVEEQSDIVDSFVSMLGHFFDIQYEYIHQLPRTWDRQQKLTEGFAKELVYHVGKSLGIDFSNGDNFENLWAYTLGLNTSGSYNNSLSLTGEDRTREIWKRIINNLPHLLKTKGTRRGVRALINCFGIPSTILRIKEYGGPEPELDTASTYEYDRFTYTTKIGNVGGSYQYISIPFKALKQNGKVPQTVEWRMQMSPNLTSSQVLAVIDSAQVRAIDGNSVRLTIGATSTTFSSSIYDGTPHHFTLKTNSLNSKAILQVRRVNCGTISTASGEIVGWPSAGTAYFPNSTSTNPFSGSIQDIRYWTEILSDRVLDAHALAPTSFFNDDLTTETGGTGSYYQLAFRLTAGADNKKYDYSILTSVTSSHPDRTNLTFDDNSSLTATFVNFNASSSLPLEETHYLEWPDIAGNRQVGNKIRTDEILNLSTELYPNIKTQKSLQDNQPTDSPRLGIYLSPIDEVNQDIAEQFGGISLDDYIGSYDDVYNDSYSDLLNIKREYLKKVQGRYKSQNYIRLLQYFNASVFSIAKQLVPHRANLQTGLVIEPDLLTRSKVTTARRPELEQVQYEGELDLPTVTEPFGDIDIIEQGVIDMPETEIESVYVDTPEGTLNGTKVLSLVGRVNEYNNSQVPSQGTKLATTYSGSTPGSLISKKEALEDDIYTYETSYGRDKILGSKYDFYTWVGPVTDPTEYSELGLVSNSANFLYVPSVNDDYSNPIGTQVYNSRGSEVLSPGDIVYKQGGDILRGEAKGKGWTSTSNIVYTGSYGQYPIARLGVRFSRNTGPGAPPVGDYYYGGAWTYDVTNNRLAPGNAVSKMWIPLPYNEAPNAEYEVSWTGATLNILQFGSGSSEYEYTSATPGTYRSRASNGILYLTVPGGSNYIYNLKVSILNFPGQFQDYMIGPQASLGLRNQKYNGCKMTSPDFNEDSPDTIDGGPVIVVTEGPATNLQVNPTVDGTYTFK